MGAGALRISEQLYDIKIVYGNIVKMKHLKRLRKKLYALKESENLVFVHDIGKWKSNLQKCIETLETNLSKLKEYNQKLHICGKRNSFSNTAKRGFGTYPYRRGLPVKNEPKHSGGRFFWRAKTGYAIPKISQSRDSECYCRKHSFSYGTKHQ